MSDEFNSFFGVMLIIGFVIVFWGAFKSGKIQENAPATSTAEQTLSQYENTASQTQTVFTNSSVGYGEGQSVIMNQGPVLYSNENGIYNGMMYEPAEEPVPATENNCGSIGGNWTSFGTCAINSASRSQCAALGGSYNPSPECTAAGGEACYVMGTCTVYWIQ